MSDAQKTALLDFLHTGRGFLGVHSATDTFYTWPDYLDLVGGYFNGHPWYQAVTIEVVDSSDPLVAFLGNSVQVEDEMYQISDFETARPTLGGPWQDRHSINDSMVGLSHGPNSSAGDGVLYGAGPRAVSLAGRPLPANPHERYPLVHAKVALVRCIANSGTKADIVEDVRS